MPLEPPTLDDRTYDEILRDLRLRIPQYTSDWTDFNESDPGITLLELFAWLTEGILYQMNRVPERSYLKFLQLVGLELRPAQPATAHLEFTPRPGTDIQPVPVGAQVGGQPPQGGDLLIFETEIGLDLIRVPLTDVQVWDGNSFEVFTTDNQTRETPYRPLGWAPQLGNACTWALRRRSSRPPLGCSPSSFACGSSCPWPPRAASRSAARTPPRLRPRRSGWSGSTGAGRGRSNGSA